MAFSLPNIKELVTKGAETFQRFPLALLSSIIVTLIAVYFIEYEPRELKGMDLILAKIATSAMLGVFVFTALRLIEYRPRYMGQVFLSGIGILGLVAYYYSLPDDTGGFDSWVYLLRHIFLIILFFVSILWTPFIKSHLPNVDYWQYAKEVLFALVMTVLFSIVVIVGVMTALYAVEELFDLRIEGKYYFMIAVMLVGIFSVAYFLSQIPTNPLESKATMNPPSVERFFTRYILTPLTVLYFIILYVYTAKVLVTMDWPKGILAWLIVAFSVVAILTYLFWTHFASNQTSRWRRWIWLAILLQTVMLFIAIGMRIEAYSWTENRYMVLLLGIWLAGISLYFLFFKEAKIKWIFITLSLLIGVSQVGPLSAYEVSKSAQTQRLHGVLASIQQESVSGEALPLKARYEISDITQYLYKRYGVNVFESIFPKITSVYKDLEAQKKEAQKRLNEKLKNRAEEQKKSKKPSPVSVKDDYEELRSIFKDRPQYFPHFVTHALGFKFVNPWQYNNQRKGKVHNVSFYVKYPHSRGQLAQDIRGFDYMSHYNGHAYKKRKHERVRGLGRLENIGVDITFEKAILMVRKGQAHIRFDIKDYIDGLVKKHGMNASNLTQKELTLEKEDDTLRVKIEFQNLNKYHSKNTTSININARIFYKFKRQK